MRSVYPLRSLAKAYERIGYASESLGNWRDKAGAYGIQEPFGRWAVEKIEGDYFNVMGLPVSRLFCMLKDLKLI